MSGHVDGPWERLERLLRDLWYGQLFDLPIVDGVPQLDAPISSSESVVFDGPDEQRQPRESSGLSDVRFKRFVAACKRRGTFVISKLDVHAGLPRRWEVRGDRLIP
jgi:hypothetical protein